MTAVIVDLKKEAEANQDYIVEPPLLEQWEKTNGKIPEGAIVLLNFNWTRKSDNKTEFFGSPNPQDIQSRHYPGLGVEAARLLIARKVFGVGTDTASIDPGQIKVRNLLSLVMKYSPTSFKKINYDQMCLN